MSRSKIAGSFVCAEKKDQEKDEDKRECKYVFPPR